MKQVLSLVAGAAIGLGMAGCSSMWHRGDSSASTSSSSNESMAQNEANYSQDVSRPAGYTEGGTAHIEDHRNDAGSHPAAQPAADRQEPTTPTNDENTD